MISATIAAMGLLVATAMTMFRLADGKIVEEWNVFDYYSLLSQLDLLPKAAPRDKTQSSIGGHSRLPMSARK